MNVICDVSHIDTLETHRIDRDLALPPDRHLDTEATTALYGKRGVFAWTPEVKAAKIRRRLASGSADRGATDRSVR